MADAVRKGKVRYLALSNITADESGELTQFTPLLPCNTSIPCGGEKLNLNFSVLRKLHIALACLLHQGEDIFPIPGTRKPSRIDETAESLNIKLDQAVLKQVDELAEGATLL
jgi:aryl-alcohol dehydrogenase-like predicted oxidoreductase